MPRPQKSRKICDSPKYACFSPKGTHSEEIIVLSVDEYETLRWVDWENQTHGQTAVQMDISRTTVSEIYESARQKIADSIVNGKKLIIEGGNYRICDGHPKYGCTRECEKRLKHLALLQNTDLGKE